MGPRAALIVALAAAGCAARFPSNGAAGGGGNGGGNGGSGGSGGSSPCAHLEIVQRPAADAQPPVDVQVTLSNTHDRAHWTWSMTRFTGTPAFDPQPDATVATFHLTQYGTYSFAVAFTPQLCVDPLPPLTLSSPVTGPSYYLRALPPESSGFAPAERSFAVYGSTPDGDVDITIGDGSALAGTLRSAAGDRITGNIRFVAQQRGWVDALAATDSLGAFTTTLLETGTYKVVIIPDSSATGVAPALSVGDPQSGDYWAHHAAFTVPSGVLVSGSVGDGTNPIANARVVLRADVLPSTLGVSGADGNFSLRAQSLQTYALTVAGDDWPEATTPAQILLPDSGANVTVTYGGARTAVAGTVFASDGTTPLAAARVTIVQPAGTKVATVRVDAAGTVTSLDALATGSRVVYSGPGGALPPLDLPASSDGYRILVEPPPGSGDGMTAFTRGSADLPWQLTLQKKVPLGVTVTRADGQALLHGFAVSAVPVAGLNKVVLPDSSDGAGQYTLTLDRGSDWILTVAPTDFNDGLLDVHQTVAGGSSSTAVVMPPGLGIGGLVSYGGRAAAASVRVEVLCQGCPTPDQALASGITDSSGQYRVYLPDPGRP